MKEVKHEREVWTRVMGYHRPIQYRQETGPKVF